MFEANHCYNFVVIPTILLVDDSVTVQKVLSLTLDKQRYHLKFATSRAELMKMFLDEPVQLVLLSDQIADIQWSSFPKEVEAWLGRVDNVPPFVLITHRDIKDARNYAAVLKKPFSPDALRSAVENSIKPMDAAAFIRASKVTAEGDSFEQVFNHRFHDETDLVRATLRTEPTMMEDDVNSDALWEEDQEKTQQQETKTMQAPSQHQPALKPKAKDILNSEDSMAYKIQLESQVESDLKTHNLMEAVDKVLARMVPPIVERLVQERLDKLLKEQEQWVDMK